VEEIEKTWLPKR